MFQILYEFNLLKITIEPNEPGASLLIHLFEDQFCLKAVLNPPFTICNRFYCFAIS